MGNPAHGKGHEEGGDMQRRDQASWGPPGTSQASTPKPESVCLTILCLSPALLTLAGGCPPTTFLHLELT